MTALLRVLSNTCTPIVVWYAVHEHFQCGNVVKFIAGCTVVFAIFAAAGCITNPPKADKPPSQFRMWTSRVSDGACLGLLVWNGWMWCAAAWLLCIVATEMVFDTIKKQAEKAQPKAPEPVSFGIN